MLKKAQKSQIVADLTERFRRQKIVIFSDFRGIGAPTVINLRRALKVGNAEYKVAKKTLLDRALEAAGIKLKTKDLQGEISVTFGYGNEVEPAKTLLKFSRENETFKVLAGVFGNRILNAGEIAALSRLPSREVLLSRLTGTFASPIRGFAAALQGAIRNLAVVLNKIKEQKVYLKV